VRWRFVAYRFNVLIYKLIYKKDACDNQQPTIRSLGTIHPTAGLSSIIVIAHSFDTVIHHLISTDNYYYSEHSQ